MSKYFLSLLFISQFIAADVVYDSPIVDGSVGLIKSFVKSMAIVIVLLVLFFYWKKYLLPKMSGLPVQNQNMKVVEKIFLDYTTVLYLVEIAGKYQVYSVSNKNVSLMGSFNKNELNLMPEKEPGKQMNFKDVLLAFTRKNKEDEKK
jgi:flagellar biogenesis protein FliO